MKLQLNDEKTCVDPCSHIGTFEGWTVLTETIVVGFIVLILGGCTLDSDGPVNMFHAPLAPTKRALHQKILEEKLLIRAIYYNSTCVLNIDFGIFSKHLRFSNLDFCLLLENPPIVS